MAGRRVSEAQISNFTNGLIQLDSEEHLLVTLARAEPPAARRARAAALARGGVDWGRGVGLAEAHGVVALLVQNLGALPSGAMPPAMQERLRARYHARLRYSLLIAGQLPDLLDRFAAQGVDIAAFKGPVLAATAYGGLRRRLFTDLDLFVRTGDVPQAVAVLREAGFTPMHPLQPDYDAHWTSYLPHHRPHGNANGYVRGQGTATQLAVDLHWGLASRYFLFPLPPAALWPRMETVKLEHGCDVRTFSPEDTLLLLCLHGTKHDWERLRFVCDIAALLRAHPELDAAALLDRAAAARSERMVLVGVHLAQTLLQAPLPALLRRRLAARPDVKARAQEALALMLRPRSGLGHWVQRCLFQLRIRDQRRDGLGCCIYYTLAALRPSAADRAFVKLPRRLSFLYYLVRPLRVLVDAAGKGALR